MRIVPSAAKGRRYDVFLNGKALDLVTEVRTLGNPVKGRRLGLANSVLMDANGEMFMDPNERGLGRSWRFGWIRLIEKEWRVGGLIIPTPKPAHVPDHLAMLR